VASANRLGSHRLDLYQVHQPDRLVPSETVMHGHTRTAASRNSRRSGYQRATAPLFLPQNLERARSLITTLQEVADVHAATPAQIALAWVIHRPAVAAIPGASSVEQLESNVAAAGIQLSSDEYRALQVASAQFHPVPGPRSIFRRIPRLLGH
jgi:aryl-alcohol dehydrogenase-like predicted oxidoreductase